MASEDWFAAKRYGYGAGLPIRWQGWAVLAIFLAVLFGASALLPRNSPAFVAVVVIDVVVFGWIAAKRTRGGWKWRSGGDA